jgi:hypothetical protein
VKIFSRIVDIAFDLYGEPEVRHKRPIVFSVLKNPPTDKTWATGKMIPKRYNLAVINAKEHFKKFCTPGRRAEQGSTITGKEKHPL